MSQSSGHDPTQDLKFSVNLPFNFKPGTHVVEKTTVTESTTEKIYDTKIGQIQPKSHYEFTETYTNSSPPMQNNPLAFSQGTTQLFQSQISSSPTKSSYQQFAGDRNPEFSTASWKTRQGQLYKNLMDQLKLTNKKYSDYDFPPSIDVLTGGDLSKASKWEYIVWRRASEIWPENKLQLFSGSLHPNDLQQGQLGDVYFVATLSALLENPARIKKLFVTDRPNEFGCYAVRICDMGEWREVLVDDFIPCSDKQGGPIFTAGKENELWVPLLEKAWAKLYGSYARIEVGIPLELLHDLTGAPTQYYFLQSIDPEAVWTELSKATKMGFPIVADSKDQVDFGLVGAHYYSVIETFQLTTEYGNKRILKVRDPWQDTRWKGEWSDNWPSWTAELKKIVGFDYRDKNVFFISFEEFIRWFDNVQICQIYDDFVYCHTRVKPVFGKGDYFRIKVKRPGYYHISVSQKSKRYFKPSDNYKYSYLNLIIGQEINEKEYEFIDGTQRAERETTKEVYLQPGVYYIYIKFLWNDKIPREYVLSSYGRDEIELEQVQKYQLNGFLEKLYISKARTSKALKSYQEDGEVNVFKCSELTPEGIGYFYFLNRGNSQLITEINFKTMQGIKLRKPFSGSSFKLTVNPGEEKIVLTKINPHIDAKQVLTEIPTFIKSEQDLIRTTKDKGNKKQRSDTKTGQPVDIWCYLHQHSDGVMMLYENRTTDLVLEEEVKFELKGLRLEDNPRSDKMKFQLPPGQTKVIKLKKTQPETSISYSVSYLVKSADELAPLPKSDYELRALAKQKGQQKQRKDTKTGQFIDINCYVYQHAEGVLIVYENNTFNKILDEEIKFDLKGLKIEEDPYASKLNIILGPNQVKIIRLKKIMDEFSISYNVSYLVKDSTEVSSQVYEKPAYSDLPNSNKLSNNTQQSGFGSLSTSPGDQSNNFGLNKQSEIDTTQSRSYYPKYSPERPLSNGISGDDDWQKYKVTPEKLANVQLSTNEKPLQQSLYMPQQQPHSLGNPSSQYRQQSQQETFEKELKQRAREQGTRKQRKETKTGKNVDIFLYVIQYDDGVYLLYENNTTDLLLDEEIKLELKGLVIAEDPGNSTIKLQLGPGKNQGFILKKTAPEFAINYNVSYLVKQIGRGSFGSEKVPEWELRALAKEQGQKKQRKDTKSGELVEIYMYVLQHDQGVYFYYENNTKNLELDEELIFELKGMQVSDQPRETVVRFLLKPGQNKGVFIERTAEEYAISYDISYLLRNVP